MARSYARFFLLNWASPAQETTSVCTTLSRTDASSIVRSSAEALLRGASASSQVQVASSTQARNVVNRARADTLRNSTIAFEAEATPSGDLRSAVDFALQWRTRRAQKIIAWFELNSTAQYSTESPHACLDQAQRHRDCSSTQQNRRWAEYERDARGLC